MFFGILIVTTGTPAKPDAACQAPIYRRRAARACIVSDIRKSARVAYPIEDVFDLMAAAEHYPEFPP